MDLHLTAFLEHLIPFMPRKNVLQRHWLSLRSLILHENGLRLVKMNTEKQRNKMKLKKIVTFVDNNNLFRVIDLSLQLLY